MMIDAPATARATVSFETGIHIDANALDLITQVTFGAFGLTPDHPVTGDDGIAATAGPIRIEIIQDGTTLDIHVTRTRQTEALHGEAETAILAEVLSMIAETQGDGTLHWHPDDITLPLARFAAAFTPLRNRGGSERICPRRVKRTDLTGQAIVPKPAPAALDLTDDLADDLIFADLRSMFTEDAAAAPPTPLNKVSAWAATTTVGVMNPVIGLPLAAYNATRGADLRVSTQAFALTATLTGLIGPALSYVSLL